MTDLQKEQNKAAFLRYRAEWKAKKAAEQSAVAEQALHDTRFQQWRAALGDAAPKDFLDAYHYFNECMKVNPEAWRGLNPKTDEGAVDHVEFERRRKRDSINMDFQGFNKKPVDLFRQYGRAKAQEELERVFKVWWEPETFDKSPLFKEAIARMNNAEEVNATMLAELAKEFVCKLSDGMRTAAKELGITLPEELTMQHKHLLLNKNDLDVLNESFRYVDQNCFLRTAIGENEYGFYRVVLGERFGSTVAENAPALPSTPELIVSQNDADNLQKLLTYGGTTLKMNLEEDGRGHYKIKFLSSETKPLFVDMQSKFNEAVKEFTKTTSPSHHAPEPILQPLFPAGTNISPASHMSEAVLLEKAKLIVAVDPTVTVTPHEVHALAQAFVRSRGQEQRYERQIFDVRADLATTEQKLRNTERSLRVAMNLLEQAVLDSFDEDDSDE